MQLYRILDAQDYGISDVTADQGGEPIDNSSVQRANRAHKTHLTIDQLNPIILLENTGLAHTCVIGNGKWSSGNLDRHVCTPPTLEDRYAALNRADRLPL